jgi:hypothetical protein
MPSFGASYHNSIHLAPVYKPVFKRLERIVKTVKCWTDESTSYLQGCFDCTLWKVFYDTCNTIDELTDVISSYISFCVESVIPTKETIIFPNNKLWVTKELKDVLNKKKRIFFILVLVRTRRLSIEKLGMCCGNCSNCKEYSRSLEN